ncbi:SGNH/GDSL hydrolase family protein [Paenibacillus sp. strain BS8-2]
MTTKQLAESFVLMKEEALPLRYLPVMGESTVMRNCSRNDLADTIPDTIHYVEGSDYIIDYEQGTIRRTNDSRIPDGTLHPMYGACEFDHNQYVDYSNQAFTVYLDYLSEMMMDDFDLTSEDIEQSGLLKRLVNKLKAGEEAVYVVYGDSISTGGEASEESLAYFGRFANSLLDLYPAGRIRIVNKAIGGEDTSGGASRVEHDIVPLLPDLISIGYGMNDQNKQADGNTTTLENFEDNLRFMIDTIRHAGDSDLILVTPCEPNPNWQHTSGDIAQYADVIRRLGDEYGIGVADAHALWTAELAAGKTHESLLLNNINHPNDYGHWIYSKAFTLMLKKQYVY